MFDDPSITRVTEQGYVLSWNSKPRGDRPWREVQVSVQWQGGHVASADFLDDSVFALLRAIQVAEAHRRRGLATAMCVLAERVLKRALCVMWGEGPFDLKQTADARAFWERPDRPFGPVNAGYR
jgi:hypothetical protein